MKTEVEFDDSNISKIVRYKLTLSDLTTEELGYVLNKIGVQTTSLEILTHCLEKRHKKHEV